MHLVAFREFSKKPKNYPPNGLTPEQAAVEFERLGSEPDAIVDEEGHIPGYTHRVGIVIDDLAIDRDALLKEQGYELLDC